MTVSVVYFHKKRPGLPAPGPLCWVLLGWSRLLYTSSSGVWIFPALCGVSRFCLRLYLVLTGQLGALTAQLGRYNCAVAAHTRMGADLMLSHKPRGPLGSFFGDCGGQSHPSWSLGALTREVPTCANMNLNGGLGSRVRWHSDDEGLFGTQGESKLIVSTSFGASALFRWKPGPRLYSEASSSWLHHGDLLVMDGRCQDEYLHCTEPLQGGERVNITFRWIRNHVPRCPLAAGVVCSLPICAKGSLVSSNADSFLPGFLLSVVLLALLGWEVFFLISWMRRGFGGRGSGCILVLLDACQ